MDYSERTDKLLALLLLEQMGGVANHQKAMKLKLAGFTNVEIADILQTTSTAVSQLLYDAKNQKAKTRNKPAKAK